MGATYDPSFLGNRRMACVSIGETRLECITVMVAHSLRFVAIGILLFALHDAESLAPVNCFTCGANVGNVHRQIETAFAIGGLVRLNVGSILCPEAQGRQFEIVGRNAVDVLPGWHCLHCGAFNGDAKERLEKCRCCEGVRP